MPRPSNTLALRRDLPSLVAPRRAASSFVSPDIIPVGPMPPPSVASTLVSNFNIDPSRRWVINATNQVYVRGLNTSQSDSGIDLRLFFSRGALIPWPDLFLNNVAPTEQGVPQTPMPPTAPGGKFVAYEPFRLAMSKRSISLFAAATWRDSPPLEPDHPILTAEGLIDYYDQRPNVAVRNAVVAPVTGASVWSESYDFQSRSLKGTARLVVETSRVPIGWRVTLTYRAKSNADGGSDRQVLINKVVITALGQALAVEMSIVPNMEGVFELTLETMDIPPLTDWWARLNIYWQVKSGEPSFSRGLSSCDLPSAAIEDNLKDGETPSSTRLLAIGGFAIMAQQDTGL